MTERGNWGRWGREDERGALNLLTPDVVLSALGAVRDGVVMSLSLPIRGSTSGYAAGTVPHLKGRPLPQHFMSVDGGDYAAGARRLNGGMCLSDDALMVSTHGTTTHVDALAHAWRDDALYNGHESTRVRSYGATRCGIDKAGGVVARGVLIDMAAHLGVGFLDESVRITAEMLQDCLAATDTELRPGDVAVLRTGWPTVFAEDPGRYQGGQPGLAHDGGKWLADQDVAMVACDNAGVGAIAADGSFDASLDDDIHLLFLWERGVHLIEMLWLEELASVGRTEFLFVLAPLAIEGGTGSPVNPLAVL